MNWDKRIPQAIEEAQGLFLRAEHDIGRICLWLDIEGVVLTRGEVKLAKALHKQSRALNAEIGEEHWPDALIAFTEKIESL